jgi:hypothetical protein
VDSDHFDHLTRKVRRLLSRRTFAGALGLGALTLPNVIDAKKRKKRKKKKCKGGTKRCGKRCIPATGCCSDSECGADERCDNGTCICTLECCGDAACGAGNLCVEGQCVTGQGTCPAGADICQGTGGGACGAAGIACSCVPRTAGGTRCASNTGLGSICGDCVDDSSCAGLAPGAFCAHSSAFECCSGVNGLCVAPCPA